MTKEQFKYKFRKFWPVFLKYSKNGFIILAAFTADLWVVLHRLIVAFLAVFSQSPKGILVTLILLFSLLSAGRDMWNASSIDAMIAARKLVPADSVCNKDSVIIKTASKK